MRGREGERARGHLRDDMRVDLEGVSREWYVVALDADAQEGTRDDHQQRGHVEELHGEYGHSYSEYRRGRYMVGVVSIGVVSKGMVSIGMVSIGVVGIW